MTHLLFILLYSMFVNGIEWHKFQTSEEIVSAYSIDGVLYIGVNGAIYTFSNNELNKTIFINNNNYITTIINVDKTLLACGTNNGNPKCWKIDGTDDPKHRGRGYAPYQKSKGMIISHNNCVLSDINIAKEGIKRWRRFDGSCGYDLYTSDNSIPDDGVKGAFVDKDDAYEKVYIVFTDTIKTKRTVQIPYLAQMCLRDNGGPSSLSSHRWSTFLKAELECDIDGRSYRQVVQSKPILTDNDTILYVLFDSPYSTSALCSYSMNSIRHIFAESKLDGYTKPLPSPAPGKCLASDKTVPYGTFDVIETYNTLETIIKPLSNKPIFEGPSKVKGFDIKDNIIYFIKEKRAYSFNLQTKQLKMIKVAATKLFSVLVTSKPLFIADIGIGIGDSL
ncbi:semaphorin [Raccoonpox virus]|uniref:Semaphorin n=1 Tax=Raccoon poxvirus TaxID=10256 RepID=A0A0G3FXU6_RACVI|nr:Semaphorin [Raccoonpox virus]AKJ93790.1 Semaphorin [Raccoonpox virus]AOP31422.1 semaphorin [Raccoonpox virus]